MSTNNAEKQREALDGTRPADKATPPKRSAVAIQIAEAFKSAETGQTNAWSILASGLNGKSVKEAEAIAKEVRELLVEYGITQASTRVYLSEALRFIKNGKPVPGARDKAFRDALKALPKTSTRGAKAKPEASEGSESEASDAENVGKLVEVTGLQVAELADVVKTVRDIPGKALEALRRAIEATSVDKVTNILEGIAETAPRKTAQPTAKAA